jgi:hypothetical protein
MHEIQGLREAFENAGGRMLDAEVRAWIRRLHAEAEAIMPGVAREVRAANALRR